MIITSRCRLMKLKTMVPGCIGHKSLEGSLNGREFSIKGDEYAMSFYHVVVSCKVPVKAPRSTGIMSYTMDSPVGPRGPSKIKVALATCSILLIFASAIQICTSSGAVSWLKHTDSATAFRFTADGKTHSLAGHPRHFIVDHVYIGYAASIFALLLVIEPGFAMSMRNWARFRTGNLAKLCRGLYYLSLVLRILSLVLTGVALTYAFAARNSETAQRINIALVISEHGRPYARGIWTPVSWYSAVSRLQSVHQPKDMSPDAIVQTVGWLKAAQYNLIPCE
ncbi:hypothetical protein F5Y14DRAFT_361800 [Nemania sp. NC0429]|nr:hypothetical protein F5Y14DRAFT_361800 [Nemania sp. NC0429]